MMAGTEHHLAIYLSDTHIADLSLKDNKLHWHYSQDWQDNGYPLSPHLPLNNEIPSENVESYLRNLLPEGNGLDELLRSFHLSKYNTFGLINALGQDIPGALIVLASHDSIPREPIFRLITDVELEERLQHRDLTSLIIWDAKPRLSSAGVQDKINVVVNPEGQLGFGEGSLCSTHILKFEKPPLSNLVLNEFITLHLAKRCGLDVPEVQLRRYGDYAALLVERFDRKFISMSSIKRRPVIDGCQALNLPPEYKYERIFGGGRDVAHIRDGASYPRLFEFAEHCLNPSVTKLKMLDWALFNALIFNYDAHGKNISFFVDAKGITLAPFYDLVNIKIYPDYENEMAMAFGDEFNAETIYAYQLADFADSCRFNRMLVTRRLKSLATKLLEALNNEELSWLKTTQEKKFIQLYSSLIRERCKFLLEEAELIKSVEL
jgi:serine/threonine-protein kinase HipA